MSDQMLQLECAINCACWSAVSLRAIWLAVQARSLLGPLSTSDYTNCAVGPIQYREQDNQMNQDAKFGRRMFRMQNTPTYSVLT
jgi:hypothetical protein